jgi:predicted DNA-binding antitoxin AbrB/MazE fold protein
VSGVLVPVEPLEIKEGAEFTVDFRVPREDEA